MGAGYYFIITTANILILLISTNNHGWMPFAAGIFGVGALVSPQIIRFFEYELFYMMAFIFIFSAAVLLYFPTPKKLEIRAD